ncbi:cytochrome b5 domain-containing protein 1 [Uranotaenia lowii]|uniref:cytochrome b5 domain-containing protein 1 n=1 Tax=Uranotaenia lowii TaxID=190385 RepID=UPI00247ADE6B|nr:cytochrome b5 domain-containing protein 1 [Uranotaenia lowii]
MPFVPSPCEKFFLRDEVVVHNRIDDAWVVIRGNVFDVTPLFDRNRGSSSPPKKLHQLLLAYAGKDLSGFFTAERSPVYRISKDGVKVPKFPPVMLRNKASNQYWWDDRSLIVGKLTAQERRIRIRNNLTLREQEIAVCEEDTVSLIQEKFIRFNSDATNYKWRKNIDMSDSEADLRLDKTLTENGIFYDRYPPAPLVWIFYQVEISASSPDDEMPSPGEGIGVDQSGSAKERSQEVPDKL